MQQEEINQIVQTLQGANNVLITVKNSPTVDELSAAIGLTLALNKLEKHALTVFSGSIPSTIDFLQPEQTISTNTDSLRDFIIALDKSKADKLRYKVEDSVVRIFITPYKTAITEKDLDFSQGDFNVDVVVALGVVTKQDFDVAVMAHGRILHDATVVSVTNQGPVSDVGSLNWQDLGASSVSEMIVGVIERLGPNLLDGQMATAFLTGIVAETDRFKNEKTTPAVLSAGSRLMSAGANQQLIAEKLEESSVMHPIGNDEVQPKGDGELEINHDDDDIKSIEIDEHGNLSASAPADVVSGPSSSSGVAEPVTQEEVVREYVEAPVAPPVEQPSLPDPTQPELPETPKPEAEPSQEVDSVPVESNIPMMEHNGKVLEPLPYTNDSQQPQSSVPPVSSPDNIQSVDDYLGTIRQNVAVAADSQPPTIPPRNENIGALYMDLGDGAPIAQQQDNVSTPAQPQTFTPTTEPVPAPAPVMQQPVVVDPTSPPAVPPPIMPPVGSQPQFYDAEGNNANPFLNPTPQG